MAEEKQKTTKAKKKIAICFLGVFIVAIIVIVLMIINKTKENGDSSEPLVDSSNIANANTDSSEGARVNNEELSKHIDYKIGQNNYKKMSGLVDDMKNGQAVGKIVSVEGNLKRSGANYLVVVNNRDGSESAEAVFVVDNVDQNEFLKDSEYVKFMAKVIEVGEKNYQLVTLKEYVELS